MSEKTTCSCGATHTGHICLLKSQGKSAEIAHISDHPTVVCFTCGAEANSADNVCAPMQLEK